MPPPPAPKAPPPNGQPVAKRNFSVSSGVQASFQRIVIYGPGGIGKSELAANLKLVGINPLFLDIGESTAFLDVQRIGAGATWGEMRDILHDETLWRGFGAVVIDDLTKAEELATYWTLANVKHEKGHEVKSIESYGWGKGFAHLYETFLLLLGDLDAHIRAGRQVICIAHDCVEKVPNPDGEDFSQYQPRLQNKNNGNIRARVREWADHLLRISYDVHVAEGGKGTGAGTRAIYCTEVPSHWAKTRSLDDTITYDRGSADLWKKLFNK